MVSHKAHKKDARRHPNYKFLVSACLAGINCTYNAKNKLNRHIKSLVDKKEALPACAEVSGGLSVPREKCEICGGAGYDVWNKKAKVLTFSGINVSKNLMSGASKILAAIRRHRIKTAILKSNSPSCGKGTIYDGTFTNTITRGDGVLASLLTIHGIKVYTDKEFRNTCKAPGEGGKI